MIESKRILTLFSCSIILMNNTLGNSGIKLFNSNCISFCGVFLISGSDCGFVAVLRAVLTILF